jgi:hypothetical protein
VPARGLRERSRQGRSIAASRPCYSLIGGSAITSPGLRSSAITYSISPTTRGRERKMVSAAPRLPTARGAAPRPYPPGNGSLQKEDAQGHFAVCTFIFLRSVAKANASLRPWHYQWLCSALSGNQAALAVAERQGERP